MVDIIPLPWRDFDPNEDVAYTQQQRRQSQNHSLANEAHDQGGVMVWLQSDLAKNDPDMKHLDAMITGFEKSAVELIESMGSESEEENNG